MAAPLDQADGLVVSAFHRYSGREGDKPSLSEGELRGLLKVRCAPGPLFPPLAF